MENVVYPMLPNLKRLILTIYPFDNHRIFRLIPFLEASPCLQRLSVEGEYSNSEDFFCFRVLLVSHLLTCLSYRYNSFKFPFTVLKIESLLI